MVKRVQRIEKAPRQVPGARQRRAQSMPERGDASLSGAGGTMGAQPPMPQQPGNTSSFAPAGPQNMQGSRGDVTTPLPPGREPSRYNQAAGPVPPTYISDVDISQNAFSPFMPIVPFGPPYTNYPRAYDYPVGENLQFASARLSFMRMLQVLAQSWGLLRSVIETRKDQLLRIPWTIQLKDKPKDKTNAKVKELLEFFKRPDKQRNFGPWLRMQLEDKFVIDAANYYVWKDQGGKPYALMQVSGETIKPLIDDAGRRPVYPNPAFQQIIKGLPWQNLDEREFLYAPMRPIPQQPQFGYSEVQQIYIEILQGIKKTLYKSTYWDQGNIPELIVTTPAGWTPDQMAAFQAHLDIMLSGNIPFKSRIRLFPSDSKPFDIKNANGELLKTEEDEWLARLVCYTFGTSNHPFIKGMNRAEAESSAQEAEEEGLHPLMAYVKEELIDPVIQREDIGFGYDDCEFIWSPEPETDAQVQMETLTGYVKTAVMVVDEAREQLNLPPLPNGAGAEALVIGAAGPVPLAESVEAARQKALAVPDQLQQAKESRDQFMSGGYGPPGGDNDGGGGPPQSGEGDDEDSDEGDDGEKLAKGVGKVSHTPFRRGYGADVLAQSRRAQAQAGSRQSRLHRQRHNSST